ncbi:hypothetical protein M9194_18465 [Vibrio sp. S4M6]|uniref:hypothetical protein n=1 Tax=Vibrio sinus TaxID=2946865 RepID=UPI00202A3245|nr:hypothetical protein [Vibrio sinus]MCL9783413.1 hypothetical protein [Vibrio sinus]
MIHVPTEVIIAVPVLTYFATNYLRPREVTIRKLLLIPAVVLYFAVTTLPLSAAASMAQFVVLFLVGASFGYLNVRNKDVRINRQRMTIGIPKEPEMVLYLVFIFLFKYAVGYSLGAHLAISHAAYFETVVIAFTGLLAGYCVGRHGYYTYILAWSTKHFCISTNNNQVSEK